MQICCAGIAVQRLLCMLYVAVTFSIDVMLSIAMLCGAVLPLPLLLPEAYCIVQGGT